MFESSPKPQYTPWGQPQYAEERAPGIWQVSTSSHGGFILSNERAAAMPDALMVGNWIEGRHHYEEDCDWARPVVAFADEFDDATVAAAFRTLRGYSESKALQDYLDASPARVRAEGYERATAGMWQVACVTSCKAGWTAVMCQKGSAERRSVTFRDWPSGLYTTAQLDAIEQQQVAA